MVVPKKRNPKRRSNIVWLTRRLRYRIEFTFDSAPRSGCALQGPKRPHRQSGPIVGSPALLDTNGFQYYSLKSLSKAPMCRCAKLLPSYSFAQSAPQRLRPIGGPSARTANRLSNVNDLGQRVAAYRYCSRCRKASKPIQRLQN